MEILKIALKYSTSVNVVSYIPSLQNAVLLVLAL